MSKSIQSDAKNNFLIQYENNLCSKTFIWLKSPLIRTSLVYVSETGWLISNQVKLLTEREM